MITAVGKMKGRMFFEGFSVPPEFLKTKQEWQSREDIKFCFAANFDIAIRFCFLNSMRPQGYLMRLWNNRLTALVILMFV